MPPRPGAPYPPRPTAPVRQPPLQRSANVGKVAALAAIPAFVLGVGIGGARTAEGGSSTPQTVPSPVVTVVYEPTPVPTLVPTVVYEPTPVPTLVPTFIYTTAPQEPSGSDGGGAAPAADPAPAPAPEPAPAGAYYRNCRAAREAGAAPLYVGDPGYRSELDRDGDGVACE